MKADRERVDRALTDSTAVISYSCSQSGRLEAGDEVPTRKDEFSTPFLANARDWAPQLKHLVDLGRVRALVTGSPVSRIEAGRDSLAGRITTRRSVSW